ncbi:MAG: rnjA [Patescibacteria group bacterium]|nr:rnjA [Patescibacteria group bacterium]
MNTHKDQSENSGHHGEFQKSQSQPHPSAGSFRPGDRGQSSHKTAVYRKDNSLSTIEAALNRIIPAEHAGEFHAKKMNSSRPPNKRFTNDRRGGGGRNFRDRGTDMERSPRRHNDIIPPLAPGDLRVIAIGGVEGIGNVNMTAVEYKDQIVVIDAGLGFSNDDTPGVDMTIPNTKYLEERKHMVKALVITHGHFDHIGAVSQIMESIGNPPIYTREFGAMVIQKRHEEHPHLPNLDIKIVEKDDGALPLSDDLKVRFFGLTHSIPDSTGVIIETPYGDVISTGDVRVENNDGIPTDEEYAQYAMFKERNVLLMTLDSTGIDKPGWTISEKVVVENIDRIVRETKGRILITAFASQVERMLKFIEIAKRHGRIVVIDGRSMKSNLAIAKHLKLATLDNVVTIEDMHKYPSNKIMMLATGGQAEPYSVLDRASKGTHKLVKIEKSDTIIFSSSVIPGNERIVDILKDALYRKDPKIITYQDSEVHASGHGKRNELEWVHKQINYKYFMPVHGNYARLMMHRDMVEGLGFPREKIIIPEGNGTIIEFRKNAAEMVILRERAPHQVIAVEGLQIGELQEVVMRDRKLLLESGVFNVFAVIDEKTGKLKKSPDIFSRGFVYIRENQELFHKVRGLVKKVIEDRTVDPNYSIDELKEELVEKIERFLLQKTGKKPIVMAAIVSF